MSRFIRTSLSLAALGLASYSGVGKAEDNFIKQPKIQQSEKSLAQPPQPATLPSTSQNLVVQPSKLPAPTSVQPVVVEANPINPQPQQTTLAQPTTQATPAPPSQQQIQTTHLSLPASAAANSATANNALLSEPVLGFSQTLNTPAESARDANGLIWVKRGSLELAKSEPTSARTDGTFAQRVTTQSQVPTFQSSNTSRGPAVIDNPGASALQGQATASAFSLAKASSAIPVCVDTAQASNSVTKIDETRANKLHLASKVSKQILSDRETPKKQLSLNGSSLVGPAAIEQQLMASMAKSEQLCRRGLFMSAREESLSAMLQLARYVDSLSNALHSEPCLRSAVIAMDEAGDFSELMSLKSLQDLAGSHETPVLHNVDLSQVPPASLAQLYYEFAESKLVEGSEQHPWFSDIFYSIGRTYQADADQRAEIGASPMRMHALVFYRVSTAIRSSNSLAANQLGYVLLQMDRPTEAQLALVASVQSKTDLPALQNLVEASRRRGDQRMQQWAMSMIASLQSQQPAPKQKSQDILEVDNRTFRNSTPIVPTWTGSSSQMASLPGQTVQ